MRQLNIFALMASVAAFMASPASAQVTAYEGARVIVGNGSVIDSATIVVDGSNAGSLDRPATSVAPPGARRVNLAGKTVMPMIIDTHVHLSQTREELINDLKRRAYFGVSAALSMGTDNLDLLRCATKTSRRGQIPQRGTRHHQDGAAAPDRAMINSEAEGRKAVRGQRRPQGRHRQVLGRRPRRQGQEDHAGAIYGAIIDEAKKSNLRMTAHIYNMEDAKGLMRAGLDAFAHGVRDKDIDHETVAMFKARPNIILIPNLPDRGVKVDRSWLQRGLPAEEFAKLEADNTDRPKAQDFHGIQARNLAKLNAAGVRITMGTDGNRPWGPHEEMEDMVLAGMTPVQVLVAATRNGAEFLRIADAGRSKPARAPTSSCSTPTRSTTSRTPARSRRSICAARRSTGRSRSRRP